MNSRSYAVIGLGQFGMTVALTLADAGCDVLAIDDREENVQDIAEKVSYAVKADVKEPGILQSVGVQNVDVAVIAVAENMEASIIAAMQVKSGYSFIRFSMVRKVDSATATVSCQPHIQFMSMWA